MYDRRFSNPLNFKESALANQLTISAQRALVRSRFLNIAQMDAKTKYFFGQERKKWTMKDYSLSVIQQQSCNLR